eukprot:15460184-Alexandrium_andersonii.AAC.1
MFCSDSACSSICDKRSGRLPSSESKERSSTVAQRTAKLTLTGPNLWYPALHLMSLWPASITRSEMLKKRNFAMLRLARLQRLASGAPSAKASMAVRMRRLGSKNFRASGCRCGRNDASVWSYRSRTFRAAARTVS